MEYQNSDPRRLALYAVMRIEEGAFSNIIINDVLTKASLKGEDRALFTNLVRGVTERRITLDRIIDSMSSLPPSKIDSDARGILRLGIYQLLYMKGMPDHAAVNECVNLTRKRSRGFVNAMLRSFIRGGKQIPLPNDPVEKISVEYSVSKSIAKRFFEIFGEEKARAIFESAFLKRNDIAVNTLITDRESLIKSIRDLGFSAEAGRISERCIKTDAPYSLLEESFSGKFFTMDEASQAAGESLMMKRGERLADICSAPGSKSFYSAISMENEGEICSFDLRKSKISLINSGAERLGIKIITASEGDGSIFREDMLEAFDAVLTDVPCSGLGVFGGKPEIKYKDISEFERLPDIQLKILKNASRYVRKGGRLVYSTCTLLPEENENNVSAFLAENKDFVLEPFTLGGRVYDGMVTLTPDNGETDGFFIAKMRKS